MSFARLVKRFAGLPPAAPPFSSQRNVGQRCDPMACRSRDEAARLCKHWSGSAEGTSCAAAEATRFIARPASGLYPSSTYRQERAGESNETSSSTASAAQRRLHAATLRAFDLPPNSGWRDGPGKPIEWPNGSGQFAAGARMRLQRTPEPAREVVRLYHTTDPPRAHLWPTFLCEEKGGALAGRREKRLTKLAIATHKSEAAARRNA